MDEKDFYELGIYVYEQLGFDYWEVGGKTPEDNYQVELNLDGACYWFDWFKKEYKKNEQRVLSYCVENQKLKDLLKRNGIAYESNN